MICQKMGNTENPFSVKLSTNLEDALSSPLRFIFSIFSCIKKKEGRQFNTSLLMLPILSTG